MTTYTGTFVGYPIAFINSNLSFLLEYSIFMSPANVLSKAAYLGVCFRFDKGGTRNIQEQTFCRFPADSSYFCPLLAALRALDRCTSCDLDSLTPIFCYQKIKGVTLIYDSIVTKNLHEATFQVYPNPCHFYNLHFKDVRKHSV